MKLYLVRHTRVDVPQGICYGHTDVPLADSFASEAARVCQQLLGIAFDYAFSSPSSRCVRLGIELGIRLQIDRRLTELDFGEWEGQTWDAIYETEAGRKWFADYFHGACPGGESYADVLHRAKEFISCLPPGANNVLIITHAGMIRAFRTLLGRCPTEKAFSGQVAFGEVEVIDTLP